MTLIVAAGCDEHDIPSGELSLGTNAVDDPTRFTLLAEGDEVPVVQGGQGAMMVVAAVETGFFPEDTTRLELIVALVDSADEDITRLKLRRKVAVNADGTIYIPDIYVIVDGQLSADGYDWDGEVAELYVRVQSYDGVGVESSRSVVLRAHE